MAVMLIESQDPQFSFHLKKNPATGMVVKKMRQGSVAGWFSKDREDQYAVFFKEAGNDSSFSDEGKNYLDLTQYASTYFVFQSINILFGGVLKLDATQDNYKHTVTIPTVQLRSTKTIKHLISFVGLQDCIVTEKTPGVTNRGLYRVTMMHTGPFNDFMMRVYILFYLMHADLHQSDITFMEGLTTKVTGILKELKVEYFLWYWFSKNVISSPNTFNKLHSELGANSVDGVIDMKFGDTQSQRKRFVDSHMDFTVSILDAGCGEGYYLLPYAKRVAKGTKIVGVDPDTKLTGSLQHKLEDRKQNNHAFVVNSLDDVQMDEVHDIICIEVIEHMELDAARQLVDSLLTRNFRKLIISTPNIEFNKFYRGMTGFRHDDHHFEFTQNEFAEFINERLASSGRNVNVAFENVGDTVNGIPMSQAVIITAVKE